MSGDCTILSSGAISCVKTGGTAFGTLATIATGTMTDSDYCTYSSTGPTISCNATGSGGGANTALSNLASVSINTSFLAQIGVDLGGTANPFRNLYLFGAGTYGTTYLKLTGTPTSTRTVTFPDATDTVVELTQTQTLTNKSIAASEVNSGTLSCSQMPALTGDVTTSAGACATTIANNAVTGAKMANNTVTATQLASQYSKGQCTEVFGGSGTSFAMQSGDDAISNNTCFNDSGVTRTITAVKCRSDNAANTTVLTPTMGSAGTGTAILTGTLICGNSYAYSSSGT